MYYRENKIVLLDTDKRVSDNQLEKDEKTIYIYASTFKILYASLVYISLFSQHNNIIFHTIYNLFYFPSY